ncbi:MAG: YdcF family protein [Candidatus Aminicenantes bacterium]|nr:YdcF family protein [Candidatus Aminicenantes bacterium]
MFTILYKLVVGWIMPPGCFIIIFIFCAWKTRTVADPALRKRLRVFSLIGAMGLYLLSIRPVQQMLAGGLENKYRVVQESQIKKTNAIIILSAGIVEGVPVSFSPLPASPGPWAIIRLSEGIRLYRRIKAEERECTIILTGGCLFGDKNAASTVSREWLVSMGIPSRDIRWETSGRTTFEEARFALPIVKSTDAEALFLVTHASHMRRAVASFNKFGLAVIPAPCGFSDSGKLGVFSFLPEAGALQGNRVLLWEYLGSVFYWFKRP